MASDVGFPEGDVGGAAASQSIGGPLPASPAFLSTRRWRFSCCQSLRANSLRRFAPRCCRELPGMLPPEGNGKKRLASQQHLSGKARMYPTPIHKKSLAIFSRFTMPAGCSIHAPGAQHHSRPLFKKTQPPITLTTRACSDMHRGGCGRRRETFAGSTVRQFGGSGVRRFGRSADPRKGKPGAKEYEEGRVVEKLWWQSGNRAIWRWGDPEVPNCLSA